METLWQELIFGLPDGQQFAKVVIRLVAAAIFGAVIGLERELRGKEAGLRTHLLVTLGGCVFVVSGSISGMSSEGLSRIIQGVATGIGFIGAGTILKLSAEHQVKGLTTSAGIWMAAAIGGMHGPRHARPCIAGNDPGCYSAFRPTHLRTNKPRQK